MKYRIAIGAIISLIVWALYAVRVTLGIGPMHDDQGKQAPASHYLVGAMAGTVMVALWIVVRAIMSGRQRRR